MAWHAGQNQVETDADREECQAMSTVPVSPSVEDVDDVPNHFEGLLGTGEL